MREESLHFLIEEINSLKSERLLKQRNKIKQQEWFFNFNGELPDNWLEVNFMDVTWLITCGVAKKPDYVEEGIPFLSAQNTRPFKTNLNKIKYISREAFTKLTVGGKPEKNDVLYTRVGNCGEAASIPYEFDFGVYVSLTLIKPIHELINHKFLVAFLNSNYGKIQANVGAIGIGLKNLNVENVRKYRIPLPPLPEQRAIVAKIETLFSDLDKGIADLKTAQAQLKVYRQAVLKKAFEGELTKQWREQQTNLPTADALLAEIKAERQKHYEQQLESWKQAVKNWEEGGKEGKKPGKPRAIKKTNGTDELLHTLPNKWKWSKLGNVASKISDGPFGSNLKTSDYVDSGIRVIRLENIGNLIFRDSKKTFVSQEKYQSIKNHSIYPNDLIFSSFVAENVSVVSIPKYIELAVNKADCFCVRFNNLVYYKFYEFFLSTRSTYTQLVNEVHGATRPRINTTQLKGVLIPLCSKKEQHQIVQEIESRLSVCDKVEQSLTESLEKAKALRQSILKKAFAGSLLSTAEIEQCKQAADYEPAAALLAKIKAEKTKKMQRDLISRAQHPKSELYENAVIRNYRITAVEKNKRWTHK